MSSLEYFRELIGSHTLFILSVLLLSGYLVGKVTEKLKLPEVTGFIIAGLLLGESFLGIIPHHMGKGLQDITEVALGLIALTIGGEFYWVKLKSMGRGVVIITLVQIITSFGATTLGLVLFRMPLPFALLLGAIATATAPAATVAIVQSLRAQGKFVDYLYGVVALDDAGAVILFGVVFAVVSSFLGSGGADHGMGLVIGHAVLEVVLSLVMGAVLGYIIHISVSRNSNLNEVKIISIGLIFLTIALALAYGLSPLLTNMAAGAVLINLSARNHRIFHNLEPMTPPVYALFFVIAGTELDPQAILSNKAVLILGLVYIIFRGIGKYGGVALGAVLSRSPKGIRKYLGLSMLPQAGVAIGLVLMIQASPLGAHLQAQGVTLLDDMFNIVLFSVFINELIGPPVSKYAVVKGLEMEE